MIDPVFCLSWPEAVVAHQLQRALPKRRGYSIWIPVSRQQPGIDLAIFSCDGTRRKMVTVQVKASRTYIKNREVDYATWFNCFAVAAEADFVALVWPEPSQTPTSSKRRAHLYRTLLFERDRIAQLMKSCRTKKGTPDSKFTFNVMRDARILWDRGNCSSDTTDYAGWLLENQIPEVRRTLE